MGDREGASLEQDRCVSRQGKAFAFAASDKNAVLTRVQKREGKSFAPTSIAVRLDDGMQIEACAQLYSGRSLRSYLDVDEQVRMVWAARVTSGLGIEYVMGTAKRLNALGIDDRAIRATLSPSGLAAGT